MQSRAHTQNRNWPILSFHWYRGINEFSKVSGFLYQNTAGFSYYCWFWHDVTKIKTTKLLILLRFYFHDVWEQLKTYYSCRPRELLCWLIKWLISGNLAVSTVLLLEKVLFYCFLVPREIISRFCSKTQWEMSPLVSGRHVGAYPDGHHYGISIQITINLGKTFSPHILHKKSCCELNLGESLSIFPFFLFSDSGLYLLNDSDFYFDPFRMTWHWKPAIWQNWSSHSRWQK